MKTEVHRQIHRDARGRRMVTVEEKNVCLRAWMHIAGVGESTFYRYMNYMKNDREARDHGNTGLLKPREHTEQATASLKCILDREADHMPHRSRTLKAGDKVVSKILPASFQWKNQLTKLNKTNAAFGLKEISTSSLSKIRSAKFSEYDVKKPGDNFARCATCDKFNELLKGSIGGSQSAMKWSRRLDKHCITARAHRDVYYINRDSSFNSPHECVTIIHDKMDHAKTASPVFSHKSKELDGLVKLPVSMTGMIVHGHADVRYAHYGLDVFAHDSNYIVGSVAKLLQDLELEPKSSSRELFKNSKSTNLFKVVLEGASMCDASLPPWPNTLIPAMRLPPILNVHMDNATGDNKNRYVFCFWSLLVASSVKFT
jgi:transposase